MQLQTKMNFIFYFINFLLKQTQNFKVESSITFGDIFSNKEQNLDLIYYVNESVITHSKDWIGIFKLDFKGINDYVTYVWSDRIIELENRSVSKKFILQ